MPPAVRVGAATGHPGVVTGPGCLSVLIGGLPAIRLTDLHACSMPPPAGPHPPTPVTGPGVPTVLIGGLPASVLGDLAGCGAPVLVGLPSVLIGG